MRFKAYTLTLLAASALLGACVKESKTDDVKKAALSITLGTEKETPISIGLKGHANLNQVSEESGVSVGFHYSTSKEFSPCSVTVIDVSGIHYAYTYITTIVGLDPGTVYYYRSYVKQGDKYTYGETKSFQTKPLDNLISIKGSPDVMHSSATISAKLDVSDIDYTTLSYGFYWGPAGTSLNNYIQGTEESKTASSVNYSATLTGLSMNTNYSVKASISLDGRTFMGYQVDFTTEAFETNLGLSLQKPDGSKYTLYWAACNLSDKGFVSTPEELGDYYAWGETTPRNTSYIWTNYLWGDAGNVNYVTKYCPSDKLSYWRGTGSPDGKTDLKDDNYNDDAARQKLGNGWRLPTPDECTALLRQCSFTKITLNGIAGYKVKGPMGSIFLPAAGYKDADQLIGKGTVCAIWSSGINTDKPYDAICGYLSPDGPVDPGFTYYRYKGLSIRPVKE